MDQSDLICVSWNIHRARGGDGRVDPDRVLLALERAVLPEGPDILALQEADQECSPHAGILDLARLSKIAGLRSVHDRASLRWGPESHGFLGTILFIRPEFEVTHADVIDLPGHCHRGAIAVELGPLRVVSTHLSLSQPLRVAQMRILGQYLRRRPTKQTILLGDFNEWRPWGGLAFSRQILGDRFAGPALRSFPSQRAILPLDRIMTNMEGGVRDARAIDHPKTNFASDHRPVVARVRLTDNVARTGSWPKEISDTR